MRKIGMLAAVGGFLLVALCLAPRLASAQDDPRKALNEGWLRGYQHDLASAEEVLRGKDAGDWTQEEIEAYLFNALYSIYCANNIFMQDYWRHPADGEELAPHLSPWPGNPFREWEPIAWQEGAEFSPGDIIVQLCPPEHYSLVPDETEVPMTYVMSINGPTEDYVPLGAECEQPLEPIWEWAIVPPGTTYQTASYLQPAWKSREKLESKRKFLAEKAAEEEEESQDDTNDG
jgi:hypothetical protein